MQILPLPQSLTEILELFRPQLSRRAFDRFQVLSSGFIVCVGRHCVTRVLQAAGIVDQGWHHSAFYRFLSHARWSLDRLGKVLFKGLLPFLPTEIGVPVDDTLKHSSGPHLFGAAMHYDAKASTYGHGVKGQRHTAFRFGLNFVILSVYLPLPWNPARGMAIPLLFRLYRSKKRCPEAEFKVRTVLARELIVLFCSWLPETHRAHILTDSEYACENVLPHLPKNAHFTGPMPGNAALFEPPSSHKKPGRSGRPPLKGKRLLTPRQLAASEEHPWQARTLGVYGREVTFLLKTQTCLWYSVTGPSLVRMVVTRDPSGRIEDRAYFCTDPDRKPDLFLVSFSHRWELECAIRDGKQLLGIEDPQNGWWRRSHNSPRPPKKTGPNPHPSKGRLAAERTFPLAFLCRGIVILWYLHHGDPARDVERARVAAPWYRHKTQPSFADMLSALRREIWMVRLSQDPVLRRVRTKVIDFIPAWLWVA